MKWIVTKTVQFSIDADNEADAKFAANHLDEYDAFESKVEARPDDEEASKPSR